MKTTIVRIGNSRGIRIPKKVLEHCGLQGTVDLDVRNDHLVIRATTRPRSGWDKAFRRMHQRGDDALYDPNTGPTESDKSEWQGVRLRTNREATPSSRSL
jgi:antitoxin MazE